MAPILHIKASVWLKVEDRFALLKNLEHTPRPGEILKVKGESWRVVEWTNRIECERVVNGFGLPFDVENLGFGISPKTNEAVTC